MSLQADDLVAEYRLEHPLGCGSLGETWSARHRILAGRSVVIKVLKPASSIEDLEAYALLHERLRHPGIVPVLDVSLTHQPAYIALELVKGEGLRKRLQKGTLPLNEATRVVLEAAKAIDFAHREGIAHGALTLENVLVDDSGKVWITDFRAPADDSFSRTNDIRALADLLRDLLTNPSGESSQPPSDIPSLPPSMRLVLDRAGSTDESIAFNDVASFRRAVTGALGASSLTGKSPLGRSKQAHASSGSPRQRRRPGVDETGDADALAEERPGHWVPQELGLGHAKHHPRSHRLKKSQRLSTELRLVGCAALVIAPPLLAVLSQIPSSPTITPTHPVAWLETPDKLPSKLPPAARDLAAQARQAWQNRDRRQALELLGQAVTLAPESVRLQAALGQAALQEAQRLFHQGKAAHWYQNDDEALFQAAIETLEVTRQCSSLSPAMQHEITAWRQILDGEL